MAKRRTHNIESKRQVMQEFLAGKTPHGLAEPHDMSRNLIRLWVQKYETGAFYEDAVAADLLERCEARTAALGPLVGKQAIKREFPKGDLRVKRTRRSTPSNSRISPR